VMILAVAIYQWGGAGGPTAASVVEVPEPLTIKYLEELAQEDERTSREAASSSGDAATWPGGIPKTYRIERNDKVWVLVMKRWQLKESFVSAIEKANPRIDFARLRPGQELVVPDPTPFMRSSGGAAREASKPAGSRPYEIQTGDTLESIAYRHLGSKTRWPDIMKLNPGLKPTRLSEGQVIYLPLN